MEDKQAEISKAEIALAETIASHGEEHLDVSYRLDEFSAALKAGGRLLDAANAAARARAIRSHHFQQESEVQEEKFGDTSANDETLSARGWLNKLLKAAMYASAAVLVLTMFIRPSHLGGEMARELIGSSAAAIFLQLLLFPIKSIPRILKFFIVTIGTGLIWTIVGAL